MSTMRDESRQNWNGASTLNHINAGSLQRIADATELMAKNHASLIAERDRFERWYREERARADAIQRQNNALRGVITRMKRKSRQGGEVSDA